MSNQSEPDLWLNAEDTVVPEGIPQPILWRCIVMPIAPRKVSKGGIILAEESVTNQNHLIYLGKLVAVGGCCFKSERFEGETNFPKVGDLVIFGQYAGQMLLFKGVKLKVMNDDHIMCIAKNPDDFKIYI